jgi:hypothetical protein
MTAWYRAGTVEATNGQTTVTGTSTAFLMNAKVGDLWAPDADGRGYEITAVTDNTELEIYPAYAGTSGSGKAYGVARISPNWNSVSEIAVSLADILASQQNILSGSGAPSDDFGQDGDVYFRQDEAEYYAKDSGTWALVTSLVGPPGPAGPSLQGSSTTSNTIGTGSKTFTVAAGLGYSVNMRLRIANDASNYIEGPVTAYSGTSLTINSTRAIGSGTFTSWTINVTGDVGPANSLTVGSVTTGPAGSSAAIEITGSAPSQTINFTIPRGNTGATGNTGPQGSTGAAATISVGTVDTVAASEDATVTNSGTSGAAVFDFEIPQGKGYGGTSTTSLLIEVASKSFTTQAGLAYPSVGARVRAASAADADDWMEGPATYSGTTLGINVDLIGPIASGTHADWLFTLIGERGAAGAGSIDSVNGNPGPDVVLTATEIESTYSAANYTPAGSSIADYLEAIDTALGETGGTGEAPSDTLASASTVDIGASAGLIVEITGTTTITSFGTVASQWRFVRFSGALTLTHNGTSLILPGSANILTTAGDTALFVSNSSGNWRCISYQRANGGPVKGIQNGTAVSASGAAVDFTGIPPWVKRITILLTGVSTNGTSPIGVQIGDAGGIETSSYACDMTVATNVVSVADITTYFPFTTTIASTTTHAGALELFLLDGNTWIAKCISNRTDASVIYLGSGTKTLSTTLDRVRITTAGGTDTFDAGTINILYQ